MSNPVSYELRGKSLTIQLFIILGLFNISSAVLLFGQCLGPPVVQNFQPNEFFTGRWYEILSYGNDLFQGFGTCSGLVSRVTEDNDIVLKTYSYQPLVQKYVFIDGRGSTQDIKFGQAILPITFSLFGGFPSGTYQARIVTTDYKNYTVIYLCQQKLLFRSEMAYVLSRDINFSSEQYSDTITNALYAIGLTESEFQRSINSNCGENEPIV